MAPTKRNGPAKNKFGTFEDSEGAVTVYRKDPKRQNEKNTKRKGYGKIAKEHGAYMEGLDADSTAYTVKKSTLDPTESYSNLKKFSKNKLAESTMDAKPSKGYPDKPFLKHTTKGKS